MIKITAKHIIDAIKNDCPLSISFSVDSITLLPPTNETKIFGVTRFEQTGVNTQEEKEVSCCWYIDITPKETQLVIKWIGKEEIFSVKL